VEYAVMSRAEAEGLTVGEAMLSRPKTLPSDASVADVRGAFATRAMRMVLLVDGDAFAGAVVRDDLPEAARDDEPALEYANPDVVTVRPDEPVRDALGRIEESSEGRVVVVDGDGVTLRGLICLKRAADTLCVDG
jgi:CBS domain-containing protein